MSGSAYCERKEPTIAEGTAIMIRDFATLKSIKCLRKYPIKPEEKPKASVSNATPIATTGPVIANSGPNKGKTIKKIGMNIAAPPIPPNIAPVATSVDTGNMNQ